MYQMQFEEYQPTAVNALGQDPDSRTRKNKRKAARFVFGFY